MTSRSSRVPSKRLAFLDFETESIQSRPQYPPRPVGLAALLPGWSRPRYLAWGHPAGNNATRGEARAILAEAYLSTTTVWHNAAFDLDVAETHMGMLWPAEHHDTLLLAFVEDPDAATLSLKPLAEKWLSEPPTERDRLKEWILENVPESTPKTWGAYISLAPPAIVGPYAIGDVTRTKKLFNYLAPKILADERLSKGYDRERRLTRVLVRMERRGTPVDTRRLEKDLVTYGAAKSQIESKLMTWLKVPKRERETFKWSGVNFAEQFVRSGRVAALPVTEKGNPSTSAESLAEVLPPKIAHEFEVRAQLQTCIGTFMTPWYEAGRDNGDLFYTRFNQVATYHNGKRAAGARTGRLSMTPNLQNVIRSDKDDRVPKLRDYIIPGKRYAALGQRDYSQQELRILAHYEDGAFLQSYLEHPDQDAHILVRDLIYKETGIKLERRPTKDLNFGMIYGMGVPSLAERMDLPVEEARAAWKAHEQALPDVKNLRRDLIARAEAGEPIFTWGGRRYYCESPKVIKGRLRTFEYKLINILVQGSAADCTKQAMVNYYESGADDRWPLLLQVHDELIFGIPTYSEWKQAHVAMRDAMLGVDFAVPMLSDGKLGRVSWHQMKKVKV